MSQKKSIGDLNTIFMNDLNRQCAYESGKKAGALEECRFQMMEWKNLRNTLTNNGMFGKDSLIVGNIERRIGYLEKRIEELEKGKE